MRIIKFLLIAITIIAVLVVGFWALTPTSAPPWTGFGPYNETTEGPRAKTLWDWLDLLVIPLFLVIGAWLLSSIEKQSDKAIELDRQNQNILTTFINQISNLLIDQKLGTPDTNYEARIIARNFALAAFRSLDGNRKAEALQFLFESNLITMNPVIDLLGCDLTESLLDNANLVEAEIKGAYFNGSSFKDANLSGTSLFGCDLSNTDFRGATLSDVNLSWAKLRNSKLKNVDLRNTNLDWVDLEGADLTGAKITQEQLKKTLSIKGARLPNESKKKGK